MVGRMSDEEFETLLERIGEMWSRNSDGNRDVRISF